MIDRVPVQARAGFSYEGREVRPGELIAMRPKDVVVAYRYGLVSLTRREPDAAPPSEPSRRRYRRRDLDAEQ